MRTIITLLLLNLSCYSQIIAIDKIDEFTDSRILKINCAESNTWHESDKISKGLFNPVFLCVNQIINKNNAERIFFTLQCHINTMACIDQNTRCIFIFDDNTKIEIYNTEEIKCSSNFLLPYFTITREELNIFSSKKVLKFRVYFSDGYRDYEVKEKKQEMIRETFLLLKNKLYTIN